MADNSCTHIHTHAHIDNSQFLHLAISFARQLLLKSHCQEYFTVCAKLMGPLFWCKPVKQRRNMMYWKIFKSNSILERFWTNPNNEPHILALTKAWTFVYTISLSQSYIYMSKNIVFIEEAFRLCVKRWVFLIISFLPKYGLHLTVKICFYSPVGNVIKGPYFVRKKPDCNMDFKCTKYFHRRVLGGSKK